LRVQKGLGLFPKKKIKKKEKMELVSQSASFFFQIKRDITSQEEK